MNIGQNEKAVFMQVSRRLTAFCVLPSNTHSDVPLRDGMAGL